MTFDLSTCLFHCSKEFTKKIANLSKQWKSVLAQARQRKNVVCQSLALWSEYNKERRGLVESIHVIDSELEKYDDKPDIIAAVKADTEILHVSKIHKNINYKLL